MISFSPLHGLVVAAHTPFHADGSLHLEVVEKQAAHFAATGVRAVFVCGTTGESASLTQDERQAVAEAWFTAARATDLRIVVHVGSNSVTEASLLAAHAQSRGASAIAALSPSYFKPRSVEVLIDCCAQIAAAASETPFYFYDIPALTGVNCSMAEFLTRAPARVPSLAGLKFTNPDLKSYLHCLRLNEGRWDLPFGVDEHLLGALAMGAQGAVGSGFNFAAPIYHRLLKAFRAGDWDRARLEQHRGGQLVEVLSGYGYMAAAKAVMEMLGVPVGPPRLPHNRLTAGDLQSLRRQLDALGFFEWIR
jgi:N-acetylneuraminate lyase